MKKFKGFGKRSIAMLMAIVLTLSMTSSIFADSNLGLPVNGEALDSSLSDSSAPADSSNEDGNADALVPDVGDNSGEPSDGENAGNINPDDTAPGVGDNNGEPSNVGNPDDPKPDDTKSETGENGVDSNETEIDTPEEKYLVTYNHIYYDVAWYEFKHPVVKLVNDETKAEYELTYNGKSASANVPAGKYTVYADGSMKEEINVSESITKSISSYVVGMFNGGVSDRPILAYQYDFGGGIKFGSKGPEVTEFMRLAHKSEVLSWSVNGKEINLDDYLITTNTALVADSEELYYTVTMNHVYDEVDWYEFKHPAFRLVNKETNDKYDMIYEGNVATAKVPAGVYDVAYVDGGNFEIDLNVSGNVILELFSFVTGMFDGSMDNPPLVVKQYNKPRNSTGGQVKYSSTSGVVKEFLERAGKKKVLSWSVNGEEIVLDDYWMGTNTALVATCEEEIKDGNVHLVVYANGNTTTPVYTGKLDPKVYNKGKVIDLAEIDINNYYSSSNGFESTGWMDDGRWNQYKSSGKANPLTELTVNGSWQNLQIMVTDYEILSVRAVTNGNKDEAEALSSVKVLYGTELIPYLNDNVTVAEKTGYTLDKWFNWDWYGHKLTDAKKITGWTNV